MTKPASYLAVNVLGIFFLFLGLLHFQTHFAGAEIIVYSSNGNPNVTAHMIYDNKPRSPKAKRKALHARKLNEELFANFLGGISVWEWPALYTGQCPDRKIHDRPHKDSGADRGMMLAHGLIWEHFIRIRENSTNENDAIIIFEDDVHEARPDAAEWAIKAVVNMTTDFLYLGHCCQENPKVPPYCLHSYAITLRGARKMWPKLDQCAGPIDTQVYKMGKEGVMSWGLMPINEDRPWLVKTGEKEGFIIPKTLIYCGMGGVFQQVDFEEPPPDIPDGTAIKGSGKHIYIVRNGTLHAVPDLNTFNSMGLELDKVRKLSDWQMRQMHYGANIPPHGSGTASRRLRLRG